MFLLTSIYLVIIPLAHEHTLRDPTKFSFSQSCCRFKFSWTFYSDGEEHVSFWGADGQNYYLRTLFAKDIY